MKKRIAALLMAVIVAISSMGIAFAAEKGSVTLNGPDEAKAGNEIEVTVDLSTNPGLTGLGLRVAYDSEYLTLKNVVDGGIFEKLEKSQTYDVNPYVLNFSSATAASAVTATGTLATLTFEVAEDAPEGKTEIICTVKEAYDYGLNKVSMDGDKITVAVDGVHQHSLTKVDAKEATCTEAGNNEYYTCSCGEVFMDAEGTTETTVEAETIAAKGHTWDEGKVTTEPTEETKGEKTFTCTVEGCGATKTEVIPALDHTHKLTLVEAKEATCTEKGNNAYYACSCGKVFKDAEGATETTVEAETIPAKGHTWDEGKVTTEPTCTEKGVKTYTCSVCDKTKTEEIATVAHQYANGVCTVCGKKKPSGGGGGGGLRREYDITVEKSAHGTVTPEWDSAMKGDTVTLTVKPDKGYVLDTLTVTDKNGNEIKVKDKGDGKFTFTMPDGKVTIEATFVEESKAETPAEKQDIVLTLGSTTATVFGKTVTNDVAPIARNNRTLLPIRFVAEALGATVDWNADLQKATVKQGDLLIEIYLGTTTAYVNGNPVALDVAAFAENNRTYLPLRFIAESLGAEVLWDQPTQSITIIPA